MHGWPVASHAAQTLSRREAFLMDAAVQGQSSVPYSSAATGVGLMLRSSFNERGYRTSRQRRTSSPYSATLSSKTNTSMSLSMRGSPRASEPYNNTPRTRGPYTASSAERMVFNNDAFSTPESNLHSDYCQSRNARRSHQTLAIRATWHAEALA